MSRFAVAVVAVSVVGALLTPSPAIAALGVPTCNGLPATIVGTSGSDVIEGTSGDDVIAGLSGHDTIFGRGGDDEICGGSGNDIIFGGGGRDRIRGGNGSDEIHGGGSKDWILGGKGNDVLVGQSGNDRIRGQAGWDEAQGGDGTDTCKSGEFLVGCESGNPAASGFESTEVSPGDDGPAVEFLQWALTAARLYRGPINGHYPNDPWDRPGTMTSAVYAFHKFHQAPTGDVWTSSDHVDGEWTVEDWQLLKAFTPDAPVARAGEPDRFEVDATNELMWLILDGEVAAIFHVSVGGEYEYYWSGTGKIEVAHTPRGDLDVDHWSLVKYREQGWMYRAWYYLYTHRWMALHGYYMVPPYPASHGCVRVVYDDADWIYAQVGQGLGMPFHIWDG